MNYLLLPGNPPAVSFYETWGREISEERPHSRVRVSAYPTLAWTENSPDAMAAVLQAHEENLRNFHAETGGPVTVVGHSLGAYFALRLLERCSDLVQCAVLLHPFLREPNLRGRMILKTLKCFHTREPLQKVLIGSRPFLEMFSRELRLVTNEELQKCFHLINHEENVIGQDASRLVIPNQLRDKVRFLYTTDDSWCTYRVIQELKSQVKSAECAEPHDFITRARDRHSLFHRIEGIIGNS